MKALRERLGRLSSQHTSAGDWRNVCVSGVLFAGMLLSTSAMAQNLAVTRGGSGAGARGQQRARPAAAADRSSVRPASAQAAPPASRQSIDAVYQVATEATTVGQIQQALRQCQQLAGQSLSAEDAGYLRELQGWLLNRRGEAYSQAATTSMTANNEELALSQERQAQADFAAAIEHHASWRAYHNLGVSLAMTGEYTSALDYFSAAVDLNPDYPNTRFNRAELWLEIGDYEKAQVEFTEVLRLSPDDVDSRIGRGHAWFYLGRFDEALADFDQIIASQPGNAIAVADRADLHAYMGHWQDAARDYRDAIKLDKQLGRAYQSAAWLMATCPDASFRDDKLALKAAERAIELDGAADYRYLDTLAAAQANAHSFDKAQQSLQLAIQAAPADVRAELDQRMALYQANRAFRDSAR